MPCYRIDGGFICMKGRGLTKHCGVRGCGRMSAYLCDGPNRCDPRDGPTCDMPLCERHAKEVGKNRHLCPDCQKAAPQQELAL